ncbi:thiamine pyrophosphate-binding protein [Ruegeria hyattellae]|uniref:thiamine pyrophosphate-binding protein n=1 Tax=Ruegeria hyattellae TaxID=3233337 RepID=UPI00355C4CD2
MQINERSDIEPSEAGASLMRGADALVDTLVQYGVDTIFALSGNQIMPIFDACFGKPIRLIHTRHEAATGFMAEAYAQITGQVGVALVTAGGGLTNAITPLFSARASQTPLLLISGDSPTSQDGTGSFQEMDQIEVTRSLTKASYRATSPDQLRCLVRTALDTARSGVPGPVHLAVPEDCARGDSGQEPLSNLYKTALESPDLSNLTQRLAQAETPLILLGPAWSSARDPEFAIALERALNVPVLSLESPRGLADPALGRWKRLAQECDLVISLGKPVDFTLQFGDTPTWPNASWFFVSPDPQERQRAKLNLGDRLVGCLSADPREFRRALIEQIPVSPASAIDWLSYSRKTIQSRPMAPVANGKLTSASLCSAVEHQISNSEQSIVICDGGEFGQWAQTIASGQRRIINGVSGVIGGGLCYALGARAAAPKADIFSLMGDGTAGFHLTEFETAIREDLPFVAIIGNDQRWNAEHLIQMRNFGADRLHNCALSPARYDVAVAGLGGFGAHVTTGTELNAALSEAMACGRAACINVEIDGAPAPEFG